MSESDQMGRGLAERRRAIGLSQRDVARRIGVSASLISQIETGKVQPSVATLMAIARELELSIDQLLRLPPSEPAPELDHVIEVAPRRVGGGGPSGVGAVADGDGHRAAGRSGVVQSGTGRVRIELSTGVTWERLTARPDAAVDFIYVTYPPGASSAEGDQMLTHSGTEYWYIVSGELVVKLVFDEHRAGPDDSFSFECTLPHQLRNEGDVPVEAVVTVVHGSPLR